MHVLDRPISFIPFTYRIWWLKCQVIIFYTISRLNRIMAIDSGFIIRITSCSCSIFYGIRLCEKEIGVSLAHILVRNQEFEFQVQGVFSTYLRRRCSEFKGLDKPWKSDARKDIYWYRKLLVLYRRFFSNIVLWMLYQKKLCCFLISFTVIISISIYSLKQSSRFQPSIELTTTNPNREIKNEHSSLMR